MVKRREVEGYVSPFTINIDGELYRGVHFPSVLDRLAQQTYLTESVLAQAGLRLSTDIEDFEIAIAEVDVDAHTPPELEVKILRSDGFLPKLSEHINALFMKD